MRKVSSQYQNRMKAGITITGKVDCIQLADVTEWLYVTDTHFLPCRAGCKKCTTATDCQVCGDINNPNQKYFFDSGTGECLPCKENCLECNRQGCLKCKPNLALVDAKCEESNLVDYSLKQFYDPESQWIFNLKIILKDQEGLSDDVYTEFVKSMENSQNKFKAVRDDTGEVLSFKVSKTNLKNQLNLRITLPEAQTKNLKINQKFSLKVTSFSESLDPTFKDSTSYHNLKQKSVDYSVKVLKLNKKPLSDPVVTVGEIVQTANQGADVVMIAGIALSLSSQDATGTLLKLSQYFGFLKRIKLVGGYFGYSLQTFIEMMDSGPKERDVQEKQDEDGSAKGGINLSLEANRPSLILQNSKGSHKKIDTFLVSPFFEGPLMIKSVLYEVSWMLKLIGILIMAQMKKKGEAIKWKLIFLKYQKKIHFSLMMSGTMDIFFFGTRILLHRRNNTIGMVVKGVCGINMVLITYDIYQLIFTTMKISYTPNNKNKEKEQTQKEENNENEEAIPERRMDDPSKNTVRKTGRRQRQPIIRSKRIGRVHPSNRIFGRRTKPVLNSYSGLKKNTSRTHHLHSRQNPSKNSSLGGDENESSLQLNLNAFRKIKPFKSIQKKSKNRKRSFLLIIQKP